MDKNLNRLSLQPLVFLVTKSADSDKGKQRLFFLLKKISFSNGKKFL